MTELEIEKLKDPNERFYQRAINATHGTATITASITIRGGGNVVRTKMYVLTASGPDVIDPITIENTAEWLVLRQLPGAWAKARRARDLDIFKREVQQRSGGAVTPELAEQWAEDLLRTQPYAKYKDKRASYLSKAVAMFGQ